MIFQFGSSVMNYYYYYCYYYDYYYYYCYTIIMRSLTP